MFANDDLNAFLRHLRLGDVQPRTNYRHERILLRFEPFASSHGLGSEEAIVSFVQDLRHGKSAVAPTAQAKYLETIQMLHVWLCDTKRLKTNPLPQVRRAMFRGGIKQRVHNHRVLSSEESLHLLANAPTADLEAAFLLMLKVALRSAEVCSLNVGSITIDGPNHGRLDVPATPKRTNTVLWLDDETIDVIEPLLQRPRDAPLLQQRGGARLTPRSINDRYLTPVSQELGYVQSYTPKADRITTHCCRYTWTTWMTQAGMPRRFRRETRGDLPNRGETDLTYTVVTSHDVRQALAQYQWTFDDLERGRFHGALVG